MHILYNQYSYIYYAVADRTGDLEEFDEPLSQSVRLPQIAGASLAASTSGPQPIPKDEELFGAGHTSVSLFHEIARLGDPAVLSQVDLSPDLTGALLRSQFKLTSIRFSLSYNFCI